MPIRSLTLLRSSSMKSYAVLMNEFVLSIGHTCPLAFQRTALPQGFSMSYFSPSSNLAPSTRLSRLLPGAGPISSLFLPEQRTSSYTSRVLAMLISPEFCLTIQVIRRATYKTVSPRRLETNRTKTNLLHIDRTFLQSTVFLVTSSLWR